MLKLFIILCLAVSPLAVLGSSPTAAEEAKSKTKLTVAMLGNRSQAISSTKTRILDAVAFASLMNNKEISVITQLKIDSLLLTFEDITPENIKKAGGLLKADRVICFFVSEKISRFVIDFFVYDGLSGEKLLFKQAKLADFSECLGVINRFIMETEKVLIPVAAGENQPEKQLSGATGANRLNLEIGIYDAINRTAGGTFIRYNPGLVALNYQMFAPSKNFILIFGPFFAQTQGDNDLGLRVGGYFNQSPRELFNIYTGLSVSGGYSLANQEGFVSGELKLGGEIAIAGVELFLEGGFALKTGSYFNLLVNTGVRFYLF